MLPKPRSDHHRALCFSTLYLDKKFADNTRIWITLQIYGAHHPSLTITNTGKSIQKGQDHRVLQDLFSFLKIVTQVFPEPHCLNTVGSSFIIHKSILCGNRAWSLETVSVVSLGIRSSLQVILTGNEFKSTCPYNPHWSKRLCPRYPEQWSACRTPTLGGEALKPAQVHSMCLGIWDLLECWSPLVSSGCTGRQICKISTGFPCFPGAAVHTEIQKYH